MSTKDLVEQDLRTALAAAGYVLEDVTFSAAGNRRVVKVLVDRDLAVPESDATSVVNPLTLDEVADATRVVDTALDDSDVMGEQPYTLEVSSPGLGRPLTAYRHFRRNVGRLVDLTTATGTFAGRIVSVTPSEVTVASPAIGKKAASSHVVALGDIRKARVGIEFGREDED